MPEIQLFCLCSTYAVVMDYVFEFIFLQSCISLILRHQEKYHKQSAADSKPKGLTTASPVVHIRKFRDAYRRALRMFSSCVNDFRTVHMLVL
jgi:hypothetical protein